MMRAVQMLCLFAAAVMGWYPAAFAQKGKKNKKGFYYQQNIKTPAEIRALENKMERFYYCSIGEFTNKPQADTAKNPMLAIHQNTIGVPIWRDRKDEYWYYLGWFQGGKLERPVAQAIYRVARYAPDTFLVTSYLLPNESENDYCSMEWTKEKPFAHVKPKDLISPCSNKAVARGEDKFEILFADEPCRRQISDALHYFNFALESNPENVRAFTMFYAADKSPVFGYPRPDGFYLKRIDKSTPLLPRDGKGSSKPVKNR